MLAVLQQVFENVKVVSNIPCPFNAEMFLIKEMEIYFLSQKAPPSSLLPSLQFLRILG